MEKFQHRYDQQPAALEAGEGTSRVGQPEPIQVQPPGESAEGNAPAPLTPEQQRKREKKLAYNKEYSKRGYQTHRQEKLAYQENYRKGHKKEIRVYQREYMRDYREGKRRRVQAEETQQPIQVFPAS